MKSFMRFISEETEEQGGKPLKHLTHVEDHIIHSGNEGRRFFSVTESPVTASPVTQDTHSCVTHHHPPYKRHTTHFILRHIIYIL